ncbi:MAG TPA: cation:proton antiporter [Candidatus Limnocylindrales bacterium]|nr:cation:proton antiporter [Candidatus Limnocylindrales bacterium]
MEETAPAVLEIGFVLVLAAAAGWGVRRFGLPATIGYLAVGLAVSPFTPGYVADRQQIQLLADVGIVLLLFEVGIEIDLVRLGREQRGLFFLAPAQVLITTVVVAVVAVALGLEPGAGGLVGLAVALSSSVVIVNITRSRRRTTDAPTERAMLGWSVLQDVTGVIVAEVVLIAIQPPERSPLLVAAGFVVFGVLALGLARVLPVVLRGLDREPDLFLIVSVATGLGVAGIGSVTFGLPLALSAFVAGLAIGEGAETNQARLRLLPFRDLLAVLFFVAIGMLLDPVELVDGLGWLAVLLALLVVAKVVLAWVLTRAAGLNARPLQLAVGIGQVGEFTFVLASIGLAAGAIGQELYEALLGSIVISIAVSSVVVRAVGKRPAELVQRGGPPAEPAEPIVPAPS